MVEGGVHLLAEDPTAFLAVLALFFEGVKLWVPVSVSDKTSEMKTAYERVMLLVLCAVTACVSLACRSIIVIADSSSMNFNLSLL